MKQIYKDILDEIKEENNSFDALNSKILLVDGLNNYIRTWVMTPTLNEDGIHVGGITGFLQTLGVNIRILKPTRLIIVFDGKDSTKNRKKINPEYKSNRGKSIRLNRIYANATDEEEKEQMIKQLARSIQYLLNLPCTIMTIDNFEADDVIGYISKQICEPNEFVKKVYIMSTDKDFYQLISNKINIWNPIKKQIIDENKILTDYKVNSYNFILLKAMCGDKGDNLDGIKGIGEKTAIKNFPILTESRLLCPDDVINYAEESKDKNRFCKLLIDNKEKYLSNYKIMKISGEQISKSASLKIIQLFNTPPKKINIIKIQRMIIEDKLWTKFSNIRQWINLNFSYLNCFAVDNYI